ncbi:MAG TPA: hypothetical protein VJV78_11220 [Polyangiales bacterium]|nr:hypothetical protein [Polyangiales bacterium]
MAWARAAFALRWWVLALLIYCVVMRHLQNIDPAQPTKLRFAKHAWFSGIGAVSLAALAQFARRTISDRLAMLTAWLLSLGFLGLMVHHVVVSHVVRGKWMSVIHVLAIAALGCASLAYPLFSAGRLRACVAFLVAAIGALLLARGFVLLASPHPWIDVFTLAKEAAAAFWRGENPYAADYGNLYQGTGLDLGYSPGYNYFPAMLIVNSLSAGLLYDVRTAYVLAEGLCALFLMRNARALGWSQTTAWAIALVWCANSLSFQIVEKWNDSLPLAAMFATLAMLAERRFVWAGVAFGLGCATKQYVPLAALPLLVWLWKSEPFLQVKRFVLASGAAFLLVCAPFLLNQPDWFLHRALFHFANTPFRGDSMSIINGLKMWLGFPAESRVIAISPFVGLGLGMTCALLVVWQARRQPAAASGERAAEMHRLLSALLIVWAAFFHSIKQSHLNYHYFYFSLCSLLLFSMVQRKASGTTERAALVDSDGRREADVHAAVAGAR